MGTSNKRLEEMFTERDKANDYIRKLGLDSQDLEVQVSEVGGRNRFQGVRYGEAIYTADRYELIEAFLYGLYFGA